MMLFFDVGETLASKARWLGSWAGWLGVPSLGRVAGTNAGRKRRGCAAFARSPSCRRCSPKFRQIAAISFGRLNSREKNDPVIRIIVHQSATIVG
jgi:hypothetical protein